MIKEKLANNKLTKCFYNRKKILFLINDICKCAYLSSAKFLILLTG